MVLYSRYGPMFLFHPLLFLCFLSSSSLFYFYFFILFSPAKSESLSLHLYVIRIYIVN